MSKFLRRGSRSSMLVIGGSSHPELTEQIARKVGVRTGKVKLTKFKNGETGVQLEDTVREKDVYIIQTGGVKSNDAIIELLLIINSCKLASAASITVITPYYPYSKGDQKSSLRSPITSRLLANMLQRAGAEHIMMLDPHSPQQVGFFDLPVDALKVEPLFCTWIRNNIPDWRRCIVVAPDEGSAKRSVMIANILELEKFAMIHNRHKQSLHSRKISTISTQASSRASNASGGDANIEDLQEDLVHIEGVETPECLRLSPNMVNRMLKISGDVSGFDCIVVDDMIDTGSTIRLALDLLETHNAGKVYVFVAHGIFSGNAVEILQECENLEKIVVTNSIPQADNQEKLGDKLEVVNISGIISEYIRRCHYNESVSVLTDVGSELYPMDASEYLQHAMEREMDAEAGVEAPVLRPLARVRKGYRLQSVCWDN